MADQIQYVQLSSGVFVAKRLIDTGDGYYAEKHAALMYGTAPGGGSVQVPTDALGNQTPNQRGLNLYDDAIAAFPAAGHPTVQAVATSGASPQNVTFPMSMLLAGVAGGSNPFGPQIWDGGWIIANINNGANQILSASSISFLNTLGGTAIATPAVTATGAIAATSTGVHKMYIPPGLIMPSLQYTFTWAVAPTAGATMTVQLVLSGRRQEPFTWTRINTLTTTTIRAQMLDSITIGTKGTTANTASLYDAGTATNLMQVLDTVNAPIGVIAYNLHLLSGALTVVTATGVAPDMLVKTR